MCTTIVLTTTALVGAAPAFGAEATGRLDPPPITAAVQTVACDPAGPTANDAALATQLNPQLNSDMRGYMTAYRVSCAREVVEAVRARGLASRAGVIAIATVIVETHLQNISEKLNETSLGLFQQQDWWGTAAQRLNPTTATNKFLDAMERAYPNGSWANAPIGEVCQRVQVSGYPDRYQVQASDAQIIVNALWSAAGSRLEDIPISGDWNRDGVDTIGVFRPSTSTFYLRDVNSGDATIIFKFGHGPSGDIPVAGDWNNDGIDTVGVFRPGNSTWYLTNDHKGTLKEEDIFKFGHGPSGDLPVTGDWNEDHVDTFGVFRPGNSTWYLTDGRGSLEDKNIFVFGHGPSGDQAIAGDWNNDGVDSVGVFRPGNSHWYLTDNRGSLDFDFIYGHGPSGDIAVPGDWNSEQHLDTPGVRRPGNNTVYLRNSNSAGGVDAEFKYGI
jgi:hypothetical protein